MAETNGPKIIASLWTMTVVSLVFMLLRYYCKIRYTRLFGWDDWLLGLSWVFILLYAALIHRAVTYGIGMHIDVADKAEIVYGIKYMYLGELFALLAMPTGKASFCVTLLRLTSVKWHRAIIWFIMITINLMLWAVAAMAFGQCSPIEKLWDMSVPGKCWDNRIVINFSIFVGAYSCLLDLLLATCPWLIIHKLQMKRREKIGVIAAMSMGCLASITCAVKTAYLPGIGTYADFTYNIADVLIWGLSESAITIIAASIPFCRLLIREVSTKYSSGGRSNKKSQPHTHHLAHRSKAYGLGTKTEVKGSADSYGREMTRKEYEGSDKSILAASMAQGQIMQTQEITVEYGDSGDEESLKDGRAKGERTFFHAG